MNEETLVDFNEIQILRAISLLELAIKLLGLGTSNGFLLIALRPCKAGSSLTPMKNLQESSILVISFLIFMI